MKWKDIPDRFKELIREQYSEYCEILRNRGERPLSWEDWLKRQGFESPIT